MTCENCPYSQAQAEDCSEVSSWDSRQLPLLKSTPTASESSVLGAVTWPTPRVTADRNSAASITRDGHWSAPALMQAVELASGILPREVDSIDDIKSPAAKALWNRSPSTPISATSTQSPAPATSSRAASRASRSRKPESGSGPMTLETSGLTPFAFYERAAHRLVCSRMSLDCYLPTEVFASPIGARLARTLDGTTARNADAECQKLASSGITTSLLFSQTSPKRGSMRNGACWERTTSAPRIDGSGCGYWLTPRSIYGEHPGMTDESHLTGQVIAASWPTPKGSPSGPDFARTNREGSGGDDLATVIARQTWGTLRRLDRDYLCAQVMVRQWATPEVACALGGHLSRGGKRKGELLLGGQVKAALYRTPRASDGEKGSPNQTDGGPSLANQAAHGGPTQPTGANLSSDPASGGLSATLPPACHRIPQRRPAGSLSPMWVEWLMGWPRGWTDCERSVTVRCLRQWLRRSRTWLTRLGYLE